MTVQLATERDARREVARYKRARAYSGPGFGSRSFECLGVGVGIGIDVGDGAVGAAPVINFASYFTGVLLSVQTDLGLTTSSGAVTNWTDQSGNGNNFAQATGSHQPVTTAGVNGFAGILFDGVDDTLDNATVALPLPGTTPVFIWSVMRRSAFVVNAIFHGTTAAIAFVLLDYPSTPSLCQYDNVTANPGALAIGTWGCVEEYYSNTTNDYVRVGSSVQVSGTAAGNAGSTTGFQLGNCSNLAARYGALEILAFVICTGTPSGTQRSNARAAVTAKYGGSVAV